MPELDDDLLKELLKTFQAEAEEHLQTMNQALLRLERQPEPDERQTLLQDAFRAAHSLKGAARAVSLGNIEGLSHALESILQKSRDEGLNLNADTCDVLYDTLDTMQNLLAGEEPDLEPIYKRLADIAPEGVNTRLDAVEPQEPVIFGDSVEPESSDEADRPAEQTKPQPAENPVAPAAPNADETIRVTVGKLDDLMAQTGELLVSKISAEQRLEDIHTIGNQLSRWPRYMREIKSLLMQVNGEAGQQLASVFTNYAEEIQDVSHAFSELEQAVNRDTVRLEMVTTVLQDKVRSVRMVPFHMLKLPLERTIRDVARTEDKQVGFEIIGGEVELDKKVLETLKDPLIHLLRNAVVHGIESPNDRLAAGKILEGRVQITIQQKGNEVRIKVKDDGRGFDLEALRASSAANRGATIDESATEEEIMGLAFMPGVSTATEITAVAGRGVGLDIVRQSLASIQGRIALDNQPGRGLTIELIVPTSLAMTRGLLVRAGTERYAIPLLSIERIVEPKDSFVVGGKSMLTLDDRSLPLIHLSAVLERGETQDKNQDNKPLAVILAVAEQRLALMVDDVITEQELAVKPLGRPLSRVRNISGAALLGNGEPIIVLNPADMVQSAHSIKDQALPKRTLESDQNGDHAHILVVDDSITTRTLEKNILQMVGYKITTAVDGVEALQQLRNDHIDLVVSDIQMPKMDGLELTQRIRENDDYRSIPVILVTSLESDDDRQRGLHAGADAYIVKRGFDQAELINTIRKLL